MELACLHAPTLPDPHRPYSRPGDDPPSTRPDLLILDELGYLPCDSRAADILYAIISRRHERASTIITTNLAFKQWGTVFPGAACVVALVDRFAQHCHRLEIIGPSWRDKHRLDPDDRPTPRPDRPRRKRP